MKSQFNKIETLFESNAISAVTLFIAVFAIYLPTIDGYFLHTDDYFWSYWGGFSCKGVVNWILPIGRPLAGFIYCLFPLVKSFRWTGIFRFVGVLNIGLISYLIWKWLKASGLSSFKSVIVSLLVITLPAFQVFSAYISTLPHGLGVTFSLFSLFCAFNFAEKKIQLVPAVFFLLAALCFNQASALYIIAGIAVQILLSQENVLSKLWQSRLIRYAIVLFTAMAIYYVVFRVSSNLFNFRNVGKYDGRNFVTDYRQRWLWFLAQPLFEVSNLWSIVPSYAVQTIVTLLVLLGLGVDFFAEKITRQSFAKLFILLILVPVGYGISLVSSSPSTEYRTYAVLGSFIVFYLFVPLLKTKSNWAVSLSLIALIMASVTANRNVTKYFVNCDSMEFRFVKNEIRKYVTSGKKVEWINVIPVSGPIAAEKQRNEVGEPTIRHTPNIEPLVLAALSEIGSFPPPLITTSSNVEDSLWNILTFDHETIDLVQKQIQADPKKALIINMSKVNFL